MIELKLFENNDISVNWITISMGWYGPGKFPRQLKEQDIINYATSLICNNDSQPNEVILLASCQKEYSDEIEELINKLAKNDVANNEVEERKWQVVLLLNLLDNINEKPTYGLIQLAEFWEQFSYPQYSPSIIQGLNNNLSPVNYYTKENYENALKMHKDWLRTQLEELKKH